MTIIRSVLVAAGIALMAGTALADQAPYPKDQAALDKEYEAMQWQEVAQDYALPASHGRIHLPQGFSILLGGDAERFVYLNNGIEFPGTEAVLYDDNSKALIDFAYREEGYVKDDDWSDIDPVNFLAQMKEGQHASNPERVANGQDAFEVIGWIAEPTYDSTTHVAHYVVEMGNEQGHWANAVAVKLGRAGHHEVTWVGDLDTFKASGLRTLNLALDSHAYDEGHRYADFKEGDNVAAYGLAGLVAAVAGVKLSRA
ncbi:MAG: DUF2167 domain-containing protein [Rhodospirillaceae bacterium]|nr:DUF2167 domain-containing protein [Rhodospirillaceae bacterium]